MCVSPEFTLKISRGKLTAWQDHIADLVCEKLSFGKIATRLFQRHKQKFACNILELNRIRKQDAIFAKRIILNGRLLYCGFVSEGTEHVSDPYLWSPENHTKPITNMERERKRRIYDNNPEAERTLSIALSVQRSQRPLTFQTSRLWETYLESRNIGFN